jgi:hypothetical protein
MGHHLKKYQVIFSVMESAHYFSYISEYNIGQFNPRKLYWKFFLTFYSPVKTGTCVRPHAKVKKLNEHLLPFFSHKCIGSSSTQNVIGQQVPGFNKP